MNLVETKLHPRGVRWQGKCHKYLSQDSFHLPIWPTQKSEMIDSVQVCHSMLGTD